MSVPSIEFLSLASSQMVRSAVRRQPGYQLPESDGAFALLLDRLSQSENGRSRTDIRANRPCRETE
ncbi:hypothetical protein MRBLMR1_003899 [Neorhizobium sp. LMR1-1-1.1]